MLNDNASMYKKELRKTFLDKRQKMHEAEKKVADKKFYDNFFNNVVIKEKSVIAGFSPINSEIDVIPVMQELERRGHICVMPRTIDLNTPLEFIEWHDGIEMIKGRFNILEPNNNNKYIPDVILSPFVAFDENRDRIGYGEGMYDKTLAHIHKINHPIFLVGVGYELQKVAEGIPTEGTDIAMDMVITEEEVYI